MFRTIHRATRTLRRAPMRAVATAAIVSMALGACAGGFTSTATAASDTGATLHGLVFDTVDATVTYWFDYGPTPAYGSQTAHRSIVIDDRENHPVSEDVTGLTAGTTFHYRVCAQAPEPSVLCGNDQSFTTTGGATQLTISAAPSLYPNFDPNISDYVTRCGDNPIVMTVSAPSSTNVAIAGSIARNGPFSQSVPMISGRSFDFSTSAGGQTSTYHVRCIPNDFPTWTYSRPGTPSAHFYVTTPQNVQAPGGASAGRYVIVFDDRGVPVWWKQATGATDAKLTAPGQLTWATTTPLGVAEGYETRGLDGGLVHTWRTTADGPDIHDLQPLPNGNVLIGAYPPRPGTTDLTPYGGPSSNGTPVDAEIQEVRPDGSVAWSWNAKDFLGLAETPSRWTSTVYGLPKTLPDGRQAFDWAHMNSFQQIGNTVVISFRHLDAVYAIDKATGNVIWKLGGTTTSKSLTVLGDTENNPLGGQHYARILADGSLTLHDNNTNESSRPRAVRYSLDLFARTATLLEAVGDPDVPSSPCCGSAARLTDGSWIMSWGGTPVISEFGANGGRHFELTFLSKVGSLGFSYRVDPIVDGSPTIADFRAGMNAMP